MGCHIFQRVGGPGYDPYTLQVLRCVLRERSLKSMIMVLSFVL